MNPTAPRVLVIDDEAQIRRFLDIGLRAEGYQVLLAANGEEGLGLAATQSPDVVVLDIGLPDMEGHDVLREIRMWSEVPVLMLSVRDSESEKVRALDHGANDYVTKPFGIQELMARLRVLLRQGAKGGQADAPVRYDDGSLVIDLARREVLLDGAPIALTRKEFAVLSLLVRHPGRVVSQQQILREVWGATHTQDTHYLRIVMGKLRLKLGDDPSTPRWLKTEPGVGYRFPAT
ncbi:DNA-binding response regulator [Luteibacter rhizovicinus DSM 16549]|jgi:two-component system KDP operon response regulator KdpE|uniref:DNA-binding response regulator n=1 Tax=Luteibacter rhizovicinus DSM 16549 TaxID=1440763 RepID=A0A0G9H447_9GAMM|nr:response regulator transcription factor [Luteibacter rhizovicinus]APG03805.1 DNA-binding response regulator [Luteibacter rhizovicinus DSM 16549]KLD64328.1 transcriptional regulator [Luteibacter rhizovicinus DSM 16549]KLD75164.1 transcriptional regulator [Xanthomonas hyacinthi DSM 19077]